MVKKIIYGTTVLSFLCSPVLAAPMDPGSECKVSPMYMNIDARSSVGNIVISFGRAMGDRHLYKTTQYPFRFNDIRQQETLATPNNGFTLSIKLNSAYPSMMERGSDSGQLAHKGPKITLRPTKGGDCTVKGYLVSRQPWTAGGLIRSPDLYGSCRWEVPPPVVLKGCVADPGTSYGTDLSSQKSGGVTFFLDDGTILHKSWFSSGNIPVGTKTHQAITNIRATALGNTVAGADGLTVKELTSPLSQHYLVTIDLDKEKPEPADR